VLTVGAQGHYPFEGKDAFEQSFPGDFIAEGLDQTRGWFYTLMVLSTALFDKPAFKNVIVNGLVLAADGKKMSKRLKNYPDPELVINSHGADALRLYLINSPVVRAEELRFREEGVKDVVRDVLLPWYNAYRFLVQSARRLEVEDPAGGALAGSTDRGAASTNLMDRWIQAAAAGLLLFVRREMEAYRLYTVVPRLLRFIEDLTNWYVKMNRKRLKGGAGPAEARASCGVLLDVLLTLTRCMAPFTPLFSELLYQNLRLVLPESEQQPSVHFLPFPQPRAEAADERLEAKVLRMQVLIEKGRNARDKRGVSLRTPLRGATVISRNKELVQDIEDLKPYVLEELNLRSLTVTAEERGRVVRTAFPDNAVLGKRLGKELRAVAAAIKELSDEDLARYEVEGRVEVCGHVLAGEDLRISRGLREGGVDEHAESYEDVLAVFDMGLDAGLREEGLVREVVARVQRMRKQAGLSVEDDVEVFVGAAPAVLDALHRHAAAAATTLRVTPLPLDRMPPPPPDAALDPVIVRSEEALAGAEGPVAVVLTHARYHVAPARAEPLARAAGVAVAAVVAAAGSMTAAAVREEAGRSGGRVRVGGVELAVGEQLFFTVAALPADK
jgi:isoleucyl-tRNA synthetase